MKPKCCHRIRLEEVMQSGATPVEDKCYSCYGYMHKCPDFVDLNHLLQFAELLQKDRQHSVLSPLEYKPPQTESKPPRSYELP